MRVIFEQKQIKNMKFFCSLSIFLLAVGTASAQFILRSGHINPPGSDDGYEYVEISGPASTQLTNIWLISIDGDGNASGVVDQAIDLSTYSTGSNGLLLLRDASIAYVPTPSPETTIIVSDFIPDLENGTNTFALVVSFTGAVGNDLDTDDDGDLETMPWTSEEDAIALEDPNGVNNQYADDLGFPNNNLPEISGPSTDDADAWAVFEGVLYAVDITLSSPAGGPYDVQSAWTNTGTINATLATDYVLTPGNTTSPLPIELTTLTALAQKRDILLHWETATERDNAYFAIERATDGNTFREIGQTPSLGNSRAPQTYNFTDPTPAKGINYYRLRQVDTDGRYSYSPVVTAIMDGSFVRLSPTAATDLLRLTATEPSEETRTWQIFDTGGRLLQSGIWEAESVQHELTISNLPQGHYALRLTDGQAESTVLRFQKM